MSSTKYLTQTINGCLTKVTSLPSQTVSFLTYFYHHVSLFSRCCPRRFKGILAKVLLVTLLMLIIIYFWCMIHLNLKPFKNYSNLYLSTDSTSLSNVKSASKRLPNAVIIGVRKCGTRALINFLGKHPSIRAAHKEIHFFDKNYHQGPDWYREQMPLANESDIVVEKTPAYFVNPEAPERVMELLGPRVKLILIVRDPVERTVSDYVQLKLKYEKTRRLRNSKNFHEDENSAPPTMAPFERKVLLNDGRQINTSYKPIRIGQYDVHMNRWALSSLIIKLTTLTEFIKSYL